ncbi:MAG: acetoin dehydrogenase [Gammaproteobacteria bacterium RIFCSPLOWO2_02_FULL_42_14]|nr:MAG: acetoin dehydrogenase [Gammaproteobacteria bacterium RIFCSPHIGHO2_02_FULL_42_43]OGT28579.1 MAG: acetoin dehydrogenase [Gammaproteobacteria bacterium RIFCSPHIGHO2_01_FULL_42_8]OGT51598.1 MAG: acetoin dehydrogenase [Gammaproteobacteria bacterium RIFCSPHIGHO2_12_FULL_41_25]OGT62297.1 MAG: acetoin dehydrogenase [Gammaproteobacteria bacterium RIFCSPLOWO2_02_FULL_42_14]OGT85972.1 MAG: acetoin dehydrogenase [Gammaproteobacteria bacterium RIFCSPLOWO2_12_FULL_42_18]
MTAAILMEHNKPLMILNNIVTPKLKKGQALVKMNYAGLCHSQLMEISGLRGEDKYLPHLLGHEGVGVVVDVGEQVAKIKIGDEVILGWIKGFGLEGGATQYQTTDGLRVNAGSVTTFSDYTVVSENRVVKKPRHTPSELSVLYGCAIPTGLGMVLNTVPENFSGTVAFLGLGGIGLSALLSAKLRNFKKIIAIDVNSEKLALAKMLGATHCVNSKIENVIECVRMLTDGGVDYCFESAGLAKTIELGFNVVRRNGGKCIFASHPAHHEKISLDPFELICGKKIEGTWGGESVPDSDVKKFDKFYQKKLLPLEKLISKKYSLENINHAVDDLKNKEIVRALIKCAE